MNISIYMNDGSAISSIDITDADYDEILEILKQSIDSDGIFTVDNGDDSVSKIKELEEERDELREKYIAECQISMSLCNYKNLYAESALECEKWKAAYESKKKYRKEAYLNWMHFKEECDDWKAKYEAECQQTDILKKTCDDLSKELKKGLDQYLELKKEYNVLLEDRSRLIEKLHELSEKFEKGEQE